MHSRREFIKSFNLALIVAAGSIYGFPSLAITNQNATLKSAAKNIGLKFGSASDIVFSQAPKSYGQLFAAQCSLFACMFVWKLAFPNVKTTLPCWEDQNIKFAKTNALELTGGHLLWHGSSPEWLKYTDNIKKITSIFIKLVASSYRDNMFSWNVVNEAINPQDGRPGGLRYNVFLDKIGDSYFDFAFRQAKEHAPNVLRVYNDYGMEMDTKEDEQRRIALLNLLDNFKKNNTPVDAVGLQSHLYLDDKKFNEQLYRNFLQEISSRGFKIIISELDVFDKNAGPSNIQARDSDIADMYKAFLPVALDEHSVIALVTWGICDQYSQYNYPHYRARPKPGGYPIRPLLFDENLQKKLAYYAILNALQHAPAR